MADGRGGAATVAAPPAGRAPALAEGVQLLGTMESSGFRTPPCLVRRADGQTIQLTDLLYRVLESVDGRRDEEAIAAEVTEKVGRQASADNIRYLVEEKLRPLGLLKLPDGSEPEVRKADPLLGLRLRLVLSDERTTRRITAPFTALFAWPLALAVVAGFAAMAGWLLFREGVGAGTRQALYQPALLVLVYALTAASAGFHEFGHAAALRRGGGTPGAMGAGIYLVWPAFYTDVTDSYRLPRRDRLRTDLGGLYFNMVFALAVFGLWALTRWPALLLVIPLLMLQMTQQLLPFVRLDGYHILADLTGVPDLFARLRPTLASLKPGTDPDHRVTALKPWVRVVVTLWVVAVVPLLLAALAFAVITLPRAAATAWDSLVLQGRGLSTALDRGDAMAVAARALSILALALPVLSTVYLAGRLVTRGTGALWRAGEGRPVLRGASAVAALAVAATAAFVLWPNGEYRPYQPGERARIQETVGRVPEVPSGRPSLTPQQQEDLEGAPFQSGAEGSATTTTTVPADDGTSGTREGDGADGTTPTTDAPSDEGTTDSTITTETTAP